ncbi:MAG: LysR substrate-binding domain-containing protein, partial [Methylobacter sp.]
MVLHFDYASANATTSSKRPTATATRGSSYTASLALRFLYSFQEAITSNRADLVIGAGAEPTPSQGIKYQKIRQIEWIFAVAPGHELTQASEPLSRQLIEQHRFIVVRDSSRNQAPQSHRVLSK